MTEDMHRNVIWLLDYLEAALDDADGVVRGWNELEPGERIDFWADWPLKEDKLAQLEGLSKRCELSSAEKTRHQSVKQRMTVQRDVLDGLHRTGLLIPQGS